MRERKARRLRCRRRSPSLTSEPFSTSTSPLLGAGRRLQDVRVSRVRDGEHAHAVEFSAGGAELDVVCFWFGGGGGGGGVEEGERREGGGERKNEERKNEIESLSFTSSSLHKKKTNPLTASVVVHARLRKHRGVLDLRLAHGRAVVRDDHELALAAAQALERRLEAEGVLARLDDERQPGVDVLLGLFL